MNIELRVLVGLSLVLHAIGLFVLPHTPGLFSQDTLMLAQYSGHGAKINVDHPAVFALYLIPYVALMGMAFYRNWGRHLMLAFTVLMLGFTFVFGASVSGPPETFVSAAAALIDGALLALAYASPQSQKFR